MFIRFRGVAKKNKRIVVCLVAGRSLFFGGELLVLGNALAPLVLCMCGMKILPTLLALFALPLAAQAADTIKFLKSDRNAGAVVSYLERLGIEAERSVLFVEFERSEELVAGLSKYAALMEMRMAQALENIRNAQVTNAGGGEAYQRRIVEVDDDLRGVRRLDSKPGPMIYSPRHPDADERGMLRLPNVNVRREFAEIREARVGYEIVTSALKYFEPGYIATVYAPLDESYANLASLAPLMVGADLRR